MQMSTISAKSFAQSARTIAYLEGECGRLKTMLDHFRLVNDKMMCDIRIAREEGMNQKCLEHRLKLTVENEGVLQGRDCQQNPPPSLLLPATLFNLNQSRYTFISPSFC